MSASITEDANTSRTSDETYSLVSQDLENIDRVASISSAPVTFEDVARQIKVAIDLSPKQLERLCDLMKKLKQAPRGVTEKPQA